MECTKTIDTAVELACDANQNTLHKLVSDRLYFTGRVVELLAAKVQHQDTEAYVASFEEKVTDYPGDKMVCIYLP